MALRSGSTTACEQTPKRKKDDTLFSTETREGRQVAELNSHT